MRIEVEEDGDKLLNLDISILGLRKSLLGPIAAHLVRSGGVEQYRIEKTELESFTSVPYTSWRGRCFEYANRNEELVLSRSQVPINFDFDVFGVVIRWVEPFES